MQLKDKVLQVLQNTESEDGFVSGQALAEQCGVTRTSVWKAVNALKKSGAEIKAVSNRGYRLVVDNIYNAESIAKYIHDKNVKIKFYDEIDSTNAQAKLDLAESTSKKLNKTVYVASKQTAGRGRLGRKFYSPEKSGIYLSVIYENQKNLIPSLITSSASVAVCRAIKKIYNTEAKIKWVNDIFVDSKKVCGILTEGIANFETGLIDSVIIGIGINILDNKNLPSELKNIAGSIIHSKEESSKDLKRSEFCAQVINELFLILDGGTLEIKNAMQEYKERSFLIGKKIEVYPIIDSQEKSYSCIVQDITEDAKLVVKLDDGKIKTLNSGEVSLHSKNVL